MSKPNIELVLDPSSQDTDWLGGALYEFNCTQVGNRDGHLFALFLRDDRGETVGGLTGWTWAGACQIEQLWVHPSLRGQGYGQQLLQQAEQRAREQGCQVILLDTYSFQAPGFYQKMGYEVLFRLDDFPPGHQMYYLRKVLA